MGQEVLPKCGEIQTHISISAQDELNFLHMRLTVAAQVSHI